LRSIRSFSRGRTERQRGFVLISALILAVLYFGLMELMLIDSQRALSEAQRFRARVVASTLAESAAELAAQQLVTRSASTVDVQDAQGTMHGTLQRSGPEAFTLTGTATSGGVQQATASVVVNGRVQGVAVHIDSTAHH
jgi:Tfp pilus assembly protein PilX